MKRSTWIAFLLLVLGLTATVAFAAEWVLFYENQISEPQALTRFYIDKGSLQRTPEGTILVWEKIEVIVADSVKLKQLELREVDCSRRRYKILKGSTSNHEVTRIAPSKEWEYFGPYEPGPAGYDAICGKGKKK